jgi:DNA polymerase I
MSLKAAPPRLLLVDGNSLAYRAFYALPLESFSTHTGQPTNAAYGFCTMFLNVLQNEAPTHAAVAFDVSRNTFRTERFPQYKANREKSPDEFISQLPLIDKFLDAFKIKSLRKAGFEADDLIATMAKAAAAKGYQVLILTGDRDAFQLANESITVLYALRGVSDIARMTPEKIEEKYGLTPTQYPDYAALRGDTSDNLPSVPGVGEKTATKWIVEYKNLENLLANAQEIGGKVGQSLRDNIEQVRLNRELTELIVDVDIDSEPANYEIPAPDSAQVLQVFTELEFNSLKNRFKNLFSQDMPVSESIKFANLDKQNASKWFKDKSVTPVAISVAMIDDIPRYLAVSGKDNFLIDLTSVKNDFLQWCASAEIKKQIHDIKPLARWCLSEGKVFSGLDFDTHIAGYLFNPGSRSLNLSDLSLEYLNKNLINKSVGEAQLFEETEIDHSALIAQAVSVRELSSIFTQKLQELELTKLFIDIELPLALLLSQMEHVGIAMDLKYLKDLETEFNKAATSAQKKAHTIAGQEFNLASPKQLQEILFEIRNLPKTKKTKTGFTTDADALNWLFEETSDPLLEQILKHREVIKLKQVVASLIPLVDTTGRIHTTFNQTITSTGRLSSQDPNLQNIPIRTDQGRKIRNAFICGEEYQTLLTADYSQIEMRIMAHLSDDENLIAAFNSGEDLHTTVGSLVFGVSKDEVDADLRRQVKAISYGIAYGLSSYGLSQSLGIEVSQASKLMETYYQRFGRVRDYLALVVENAKKTGYTQTILGRRRYLPDLNSPNRQLQQMSERMALNAPIQGSAADLIKLAMLKVQAEIDKNQFVSRLVLQVHDELIIEVANGELEALREILPQAMGEAFELKVPLAVSLGIGPSWAQAAH